MALNVQDFTTIVRNTVTAIQASSKQLIDLTIGSVLRAIVEANAAAVLWLQSLIVQLLATTRAATSSGVDLDTWMADYSVTRLADVAATGQVTFSRFTTTLQAVVTFGAQVQSADGTQTFNVTTDTANSAYSATLGGYVLAVGVGSVTVPIQAVTAGSGANVAIGTITVIIQATPGVDTVTNAAALTNGADAETDAALRTRFIAYIASLSKATKGAVGYAITSLQQGMSYSLTENVNYSGAAQLGYFYVVVDDGSGTPSGALLTTVSNAIEAVRPVTSTYGVFAPTVTTANVAMTITTAAGYTHSAVVTLVVNAIKNYINALTLGQTLAYSRLAQLAYDASPGVTNVTATTLNSAALDLTATAQAVIKAGTVSVS